MPNSPRGGVDVGAGGRHGWRPHTVGAVVLASGLGLVAAPVWAQGDDGVRQALGLLMLPALALASGALQAVLAVLFPRWTAATRAAVEERRGLCLLWGFLIALSALIVTLLLSAIAEPLGVLGLVLVLAALLMSLAGYVGLAAALGARLIRADLAGEDNGPLQALAGGLTLCSACLVPIIGQALALALLFASMGAAAVALFRRPEAVRPPAAG